MTAGNVHPPPAGSSTAKAPLRVALMIDSYIQPRWRHKIIAEIVASVFASVVLVIMNGDPEDKAHAPTKKIAHILRQRRHLLYKLYTRMDDAVFGKAGDACVNILKRCGAVLGGIPLAEHVVIDSMQRQNLCHTVLHHQLCGSPGARVFKPSLGANCGETIILVNEMMPTR